MTIDPDRVIRCKSYTPGLTEGRLYIRRGEEADGMIEVADDYGRIVRFWNWRFDPGPPVPPKLRPAWGN